MIFEKIFFFKTDGIGKETIITTPEEIKEDIENLCPFEFWEKYLNPDYVERIIINSPNFKQII